MFPGSGSQVQKSTVFLLLECTNIRAEKKNKKRGHELLMVWSDTLGTVVSWVSIKSVVCVFPGLQSRPGHCWGGTDRCQHQRCGPQELRHQHPLQELLVRLDSCTSHQVSRVMKVFQRKLTSFSLILHFSQSSKRQNLSWNSSEQFNRLTAPHASVFI